MAWFRKGETAEPMWAIGLMSGTSLDGIDVALIRTNGIEVLERGPWATVHFDAETRTAIREAVYLRGDIAAVENMVTRKHAEAVQQLLKTAGMKAKEIGIVGFHGQTITHRPNEGITWQIGNGAMLAELTKIDVVCDFRRRDVAAGGQGAPLVPLYHAALAKHLPLPVVILNTGGIANVTWIGRSEATEQDIMALDILAFDTGPGNVLLNEWVYKQTGRAMDENGVMALAGEADNQVLSAMMADPFFSQHPPKSLDRNYFSIQSVEHLSDKDGAATLVAFTAEAVRAGMRFFPVLAKRWYVAGGGRHNPALMQALAERLGEVYTVEALGWEGDAMEAQAFAYLAVRSLYRMPLSLPTTTGASRVVTGGAFYPA